MFFIETKQNETFSISLKSIPTTGYKWKVIFDEDMIELTEQLKFSPLSEKIGAGRMEVFKFKAKKTGQTTIKMSYQRDWSPQPKETLEYKITII